MHFIQEDMCFILIQYIISSSVVNGEVMHSVCAGP